jgi:hypothetical protein
MAKMHSLIGSKGFIGGLEDSIPWFFFPNLWFVTLEIVDFFSWSNLRKKKSFV